MCLPPCGIVLFLATSWFLRVISGLRELACKSATGVSCCLSGFPHGVSSPLTLTLKLLTLGCFSLLVHRLLPKQWLWEHGYRVEAACKNILFQYNMQIEECTDLQCMGFGSFTNLQPCSRHADQAVGHFHPPETPSNPHSCKGDSYSDRNSVGLFAWTNQIVTDNTRASEINSPVVTKITGHSPSACKQCEAFQDTNEGAARTYFMRGMCSWISHIM